MKNKFPMQLKNGVEVMSLSANGGTARVNLRASIDAEAVRTNGKLAEKLQASGSASLFFDFAKNQSKSDNFNFERIEDVLPEEADFIYVPFRALSKTLISGHCLDLTTGDVLRDATELLRGATIYPNHDQFDINNALGVVADVNWDEDDTAGKGAPGINALYKIDALLNPRIARLLLIKAIHSTSLTILFEFDFSHPELVEQNRFWDLLGEEVDGSIVRLIITKIIDFWEASLVHQGADRMAKVIAETETDQLAAGDDEEIASLGSQIPEAAGEPPPNSNEEKTMNIPKEKREALGIGFDGDDVPETEIFKAAEALAEKVAGLPGDIDQLKAQAAAGATLLEAKRNEVIAKAKLAELGSAEGDLDEVIVDQLNAADAEGLIKFEKYYDKRIGDKFPKGGRSSEEDPAGAGAEPETAGLAAGDDPTAGLL
ncbi:MAG: hypothetical protein AB7J13_17160 [Pyrinomonadaceae bacterium]